MNTWIHNWINNQIIPASTPNMIDWWQQRSSTICTTLACNWFSRALFFHVLILRDRDHYITVVGASGVRWSVCARAVSRRVMLVYKGCCPLFGQWAGGGALPSSADLISRPDLMSHHMSLHWSSTYYEHTHRLSWSSICMPQRGSLQYLDSVHRR